MSILFTALHRAASAHRHAAQTAPGLMPAMTMPPRRASVPWWLGLLGGLALGLGVAGVLVWRQAGSPAPDGRRDMVAAPAPIIVAAAPAVAPTVKPIAPARGVGMPAANDTGFDGIRLEAQALTMPQPLVDEVARAMEPLGSDRLPRPAEAAPPAFEISTSSGVAPNLARADAAARRGDYPAALIAYEAVLDRTPHHRAARIGRAYALQQTGEAGAAAAQWRALHQDDPADSAISANYAAALGMQSGADAAAELAGLRAAMPRLAAAHAAYAAQRARAGDYEAAQSGYEQAFALDPSPVTRLNLAIIADKQGDSAQALALYRRTMEARAELDEVALPMKWDSVAARIAWLAKDRMLAANSSAYRR